MIPQPATQAPADLLTPQGVRDMLQAECTRKGGQRAFARHYGVSESRISEALHCRSEACPQILAALGLIEVRRYVPVRRALGGGNAR